MKYTVLGAGKMGGAVAYDLARFNPGDEVVLADLDPDRAKKAASEIGPNVTPLCLDVRIKEELIGALKGTRVAISALPYVVNYEMATAAIESGAHMCDMGGNDDVVLRQHTLDSEARRRDIAIIPNCGLAPGLINILAMHGAQQFEALDSIHLRVGGLPQHPRPPLQYQIVFSVEGLINEYVEKATVIRHGQRTTVDSLTGLEEIRFPEPFGAMEAFFTSGGVSLLPHLLEGKVNELDYKTIRYKGHCEKFKTLLELGFASTEPLIVGDQVQTTKEFFINLLSTKLGYDDPDVVLGRATIAGRKDGTLHSLAYEFIDYYDEASHMTAMMRGTAFPTSITAQLLARGLITSRGVTTPEACVPGGLMISELAKRQFVISATEPETGS